MVRKKPTGMFHFGDHYLNIKYCIWRICGWGQTSPPPHEVRNKARYRVHTNTFPTQAGLLQYLRTSPPVSNHNCYVRNTVSLKEISVCMYKKARKTLFRSVSYQETEDQNRRNIYQIDNNDALCRMHACSQNTENVTRLLFACSSFHSLT